uniref:Putative ovule protein n=1 Tax=Solanum chacoense TaxID=4108 RepID=A0A0V0GV54_SOLCH
MGVIDEHDLRLVDLSTTLHVQSSFMGCNLSSLKSSTTHHRRLVKGTTTRRWARLLPSFCCFKHFQHQLLQNLFPGR